MAGWPYTDWEKRLAIGGRHDPWDAPAPPAGPREGGGAARDRLLHRWRILMIAEKTGWPVNEVIRRLGLAEAG